MNASSHQTPGPMPGPVPLQHVSALQAVPAVVNPEVAPRLVVDRLEPLFPQCFDCGMRKGPLLPCPQGRRYPSGGQVLHCAEHTPATTPVQAAAGVMRAAVNEGHRSVDELAQAEEDAGLLFDPQRAKDIADAAYEQAKAENAAELAAAAQDREAREWFHTRQRAVGQLCEDRRLDDTLKVGEILAALDGRTPATLPLTVRWDGTVTEPTGVGPGKFTLVPCTTARGGPAVLVLDDEQRLALGGQLLATDRLTWACPTTGCGMTADELDGSGPPLFGWIRVQVAGVDGPPRWWCSPGCVHAALTAAAAELAADDQAAAADPRQQAAVLNAAVEHGRRYFTDDDPPGEDEPDFHRVDDDEPHCARCGCSARRPCPGGCHWVPNAGMVDLCSRCARPEDITPEASPTGGAL